MGILENKFLKNHRGFMASDECGRGPLAGPVVAASVYCQSKFLKKLISDLLLVGVKDSKKLSSKKIEKIVTEFCPALHSSLPSKKNFHEYRNKKNKFSYSVSVISSRKIDQINILNASLLAMNKSAKNIAHLVKPGPVIWLIDGPYAPGPFVEGKQLMMLPLVRGDSKSTLIAFASVLAKFYRDRLMARYDKSYPGYGFSSNMGYPTLAHREAIKKFGVLPIHRKSFKGVKEFL